MEDSTKQNLDTKAQGASASEYASRIASAVRQAEGAVTVLNRR